MTDTIENLTIITTTDSVSKSIYDVRTNRQRLLILVLLALTGLVLPFSDTVYLPALAAIEHDLHASTVLVDYTISTYMITAGIASLFWGPLSDRFGRKILLIVTLILFVAFTIVCILARSILVLLIFRSLQGGAISASFVVGQSAIVDIYPSERLGFAMGLFLVPLLIGPIVGPFIGGILSDSFGWRSTFISLAIMSGVAIVVIFFFVPETHHYFVVQRLSHSKKEKQKEMIIIKEADTIGKPEFVAPWRPFVFLMDMSLTPHIAVCNMNFTMLFVVFTLISNRLAQKPYSLSPFHIGLCYIPTGIASLLGSILGGWISDWAAKRFPRALESRLILNGIGSLSCPIGLLICGWTLHFGKHLVGPLVGASLFCFGEAFMFTGTCAFATVKKPTATGAVLGLINSISFFSAGVGIIIAVPLLAVMKFGPLFSLLAGILFVLLAISMIIAVYQIRKSYAATIHANDRKPNSSSHVLVDESKRIDLMQWF